MCLRFPRKIARSLQTCLTTTGANLPTVSASADGHLHHLRRTVSSFTHSMVSYRQMVSASVCSCSSINLSLSLHKRHLHQIPRARSVGKSSSAEWVRDSSDRDIGQIHRVVGLDPGRKSLFTAASQQQTACRNSAPMEQSTQLRFCKDFNLKAALEETPSAKVATVPLFMEHVQYRMQYEAAVVTHFGDRRHRQLRWRTFIKRQQAYSAICKAISARSADTIVAYGDASFSSSSGKGNPSTPTVSLRRILGYHCKVFDTDEFRTSRLCCACKTPMGGMPLPVTGDFLLRPV